MNKEWLWIIFLIMVAWPALGDDGFVITHATTSIHGDEYQLNIQVEYTFDAAVLEALDNGVPLTIEMRIKARHEGSWLWENNVVDFTKLSSIRYQPITELYTVTHLPYGPKRSFVTRAAAITALGDLEGLPLLKRSLLKPDKNYIIYLKVSLDLEALPLPLRPMAHITPAWNLSSGWTQWPLSP